MFFLSFKGKYTDMVTFASREQNVNALSPQEQCRKVSKELRRLKSHNTPGLKEGIKETKSVRKSRTISRTLMGEIGEDFVQFNLPLKCFYYLNSSQKCFYFTAIP